MTTHSNLSSRIAARIIDNLRGRPDFEELWKIANRKIKLEIRRHFESIVDEELAAKS